MCNKKKKIEFEGNKILDRTGEKAGRLTALYPTKKNGYKVYWMFECECGNKKEIRADQVFSKSASVKSCGCLFKEMNQTVNKERLLDISQTHGMSKTRFYKIWKHLKSRCDNPGDNRYSEYGGRGITYCTEWKEFENFKNDMYESYLEHCKEFNEEDTTIDRINVDGNYTKDNCKWSTKLEQANNKQNTIWVLLESGNKISLHDYCRLTGKIYFNCIYKYKNSEYTKSKIIPEEFLKTISR